MQRLRLPGMSGVPRLSGLRRLWLRLLRVMGCVPLVLKASTYRSE
jgi:hypothetical protein